MLNILHFKKWFHSFHRVLLTTAFFGFTLALAFSHIGLAQDAEHLNKNLKIAVIGAGSSGLTAAYTLKKNGYNNVTVFEKEPQVGGKVQTYYHEGRPYDMGAVVVTDKYATVLRLANELGISTTTARDVSFLDVQGQVHSGFNFLKKTYNPLEFTKASLAYLWTQARFPGLKKPGFAHLSKELHQNLGEFSRRRGFLPVTYFMSSIMTGCGYGFYDEIPAMYWMKLMPFFTNHSITSSIMLKDTLMGFPEGFQSLFNAMAHDLNVKVNTPVTKVVRYKEAGKDKVAVTTPEGAEEFDRVIVATPLEHSRHFMDLSKVERDLFNKIRNIRYAATLAISDNVNHAAVVNNVTRDKINHVNFVGQFTPDTGVSIYYQILDNKISKEEALIILRSDLQQWGISIDQVLTQKIWNYFPHVSQKDLDAGFYAKLDDQQGIDGTYYVGGLLSFETVEHTATYSKYLMNRFFP